MRRIVSGVMLALILISTLTIAFNIQSVKAESLYTVATGADRYSTACSNQRKLAITSDGHLHAVYHKKDINGILQIFHAESADGGKTWAEEQVTSSSIDQCFPALAVDSNDNLHLVWNEGWPSKPGIVPYTYYKKKTSDGWQLTELVASYATYPSIAIDSKNNVHVVYGAYIYEPGYWGGGNGIRWRMRTSEGWQTEGSISSEKYWVRFATIAIDSKDNIHVAWDHCPKYRYYDMHYRKRTAMGWETEVEISRDSDSLAAIPSIAIDSNDYVHVVWHYLEGNSYAYSYDGYYSIRHRVYTDSWQPIEVIAGPTKYWQLHPTVAVDGKNNIHVVWYGFHLDSPNMFQIRYRKYTTSWQPIEALTSSTSYNQTYPSLMWALYPMVNGVRTNRPADGYSFIWTDGSTIKYWPTTPPIQAWLFDSDFQYNLDDNYGTVEGDGHIRGTATLSGSDLLIQGEVSIYGQVPSHVPTVYLIATDGLDREYARQIVDLSQFTYSQTAPNTYTFQGKIHNAIKPVNNGHYEVEAQITYINQRYEFFINTNSKINSHYLPLTTLPPENKPPTCIVKLQKDGVEISEVNVGEFFDIYVGDSTDDTGIKYVRFSSDDFQDGVPTGNWTKWYDWSVSEGDWNAETKIKRWSFSTYGAKEVWAEVKDTGGNVARAHAKVFSGWTFAIITDLHIGRGYPDYGGKGWNDTGTTGQDYYLTKRLSDTVCWINENREKYNIKFLVVLGDIADSGECSEMAKAKEILNTLRIPYFPVIGNHDVWSKVQGSKEEPIGDYYFESIFNKTFLDSQIKRLGGEVEWNSTYDFILSRFYNYAFDYRGVTFLFLDFVNREKSPMGIFNARAVLNIDTMMWMEDWLRHASSEGKPVIIFTHHPMVDLNNTQYLDPKLLQYISTEVSCFDDNDLRQIENLFRNTGANVKANFAGHVHGFYDLEKAFIPEIWNPVFLNANVNYKNMGFTPAGIDVVTTEALMVASNEPVPKGFIRIVEMGGNKIEGYDIIKGDHLLALNPYFKEIEWSPRLAGFPPKAVWEVEFELYAFTGLTPLYYIINFGDGSQISTNEIFYIGFPPYYLPIELEHNYPKEGGQYEIELTAKSYVPNETISRKILLPRWKWGFITCSPVDLILTDPDGYTISKQENEIPGACYFEVDIDGDGELNDVITLPERKLGDYFITVIPEPDANLTDSYTLQVLTEDDIILTLAENVKIVNIPTQPYIIRSTETEIIPIIPARVDFDPDTLNLRGKGKWVTAYIELPEGYNVSDINIASITLNGTIPVDLTAPCEIGDYDNDGTPDLMVKFDRTAVSEFILSKGVKCDSVTLTVAGKLYDGIEFEGSDVIRVRMPGDINMDGKVDMKDIVVVAKAFGTFPGRARWNPIADENEDGKIDIFDLVLVAFNFGKTYT